MMQICSIILPAGLDLPFFYWLRYGLGTGRPFRTLQDIFSAHLESPGTRAYTVREASELFGRLERVSARTVVTVFDLRLGRRRFLPLWTHRLVPSRWGGTTS